MRLAIAYGDAALAVLKRDMRIFLSYRFRLFAPVLTALFTVLLFHFISRLVSSRAAGSPDQYYAFVVVGIVIIGVLNATLVAPPLTLRQELVAGTFERIVLSPFGAVGGAISMTFFPFVLAVVISMITLAFAAIAFGLSVSWTSAPLAIPVALLGELAFLPFGIFILSAVMALKQTNAGASFVVAGIALVAGIYFPVDLLPTWIRWLSEVQPFTPAVDLLRHVLIGIPLVDPPWLELLKLVAFAAVLIPVSVWTLAAAVRISRRRATIIEY